LIIFAATALAAKAGVVLSDDFSYPDGGIVTNSTWVNSSGTANTMLVSGQQLEVTTSRWEDIANTLAGGPYATNGAVTALYSSLTLKCTYRPTSGGTYFAHFTGANAYGPLTGHRARIWASTTNFAAAKLADPGNFLLSIVNNGLGNATNAQWTTELATNVTYTIVTKYVIGTGIATMWINPTNESDPSVTGTDPVPLDDIAPNGLPTNGVINISHYAFRQATGEGTMLIDNLKVGTQFADVAGPNTAPTISSIQDQNIPANSNTGPLAFDVSDAETAASSLVVTADSSNTTLVPTNNISLAVVGGGGTNRTVTVTPVAGQQGATTITLTVSDGVNSSFTTFQVIVGAPTVSSIENQITAVNTATPAIPFTVGDPEGDTLTFSKSSSNTNLITTNNIALGGSGANRTVTLTPQSGQTGVATITIGVSDGHNTASTSFKLTVHPAPIGVLLSDSFSYTSWTFGIPQGLYGADGSPWVHVSGTTYELQVTNGYAELIYTNTEDLGAPLSGEPYAASNGVIFYTGFTVVFTYLPSQSGSYFAHLKDSASGTSTFMDRIYAATTNAAPGCFRLGLANYSSSMSAQFPRDLCLNHAYRVVTRYNSGTGESWLWVNPASENSPNAAATDNPTAAQVGGYGLRQSTGIGIIDMDDLVVGTSFSDVSSAPSSPTLNKQVIGTDLILSWSNPLFTLQTAPTVTGTYSDVPCAASPYTNAITGSEQYFRLRY